MNEVQGPGEELRLLGDSLPEYGFAILDEFGSVVSWSKGCEKLTGFADSEMTGKHITAIYNSDDIIKGTPHAAIEASRESGSHVAETWLVRKGGKRFFANITTGCLKKGDVIIGYSKLFRDITEKMLAEKTIRESEERFRVLVETVSDYGIFMLDPTGMIVSWNKGAERLKGYTAGEIVGQHFSVFYPREDIERNKPANELLIAASEGRVTDEGWRVRKGGSRFYANVTITALRNPDGTLRGFAKVTKDITQRMQAELQLRDSEERYRLLVDGVKDYAIVMVDAAGMVTSWNIGAEHVFGFASSEVIGRHFSIVYTPEEIIRGLPVKDIEQATAEGCSVAERAAVRKDGTRIYVSFVMNTLGTARRGYSIILREITEKVLADRLLKASEEKFRLLVENVTDYAIIMLDPNGRVSSWNKGAQRLNGYSASEIMGRHFSVFYPDEEALAGHPARELREAAETGHYFDEGWRVRKDGTRFFANVTVTPLRDPSGALCGYAKVIKDITERMLADQSLRESEEKFRLLVENVSDYAIFMLEADGRIASWNKGAERLKGYRANEIIGQHFSVFYPQADVDAGKPARELETAIAEGRYEEEGWRVRKDGTRFFASVTITPLRSSTGILRGFAKVTRDITQRMQAEMSLRDSEERFRLLVEGVTDYAIFMLDPEGKIASWNKGAERMGGYVANEVIGRSFALFYNAEDIEAGKPDTDLRQATSDGSFIEEGWRVRRDGTRFFASVVLTALRGSTGTLRGFSNVTRDITERKLAQEALEKLNSNLEQRVKERTAGLAAVNEELKREVEERKRAEEAATAAARAKTEFLANISHEIRTPMTAILGFADLLKDDSNAVTEEERQHAIVSIRRSSEHLLALINDVLDLSSIEAGKITCERSRTSIPQSVSYVASLMRPRAVSKGLKLIVTYSSPIPATILTDPTRLHQILFNLVGNAVKFTSRGHVAIDVAMMGGPQDRKIAVTVMDTGPGMTQEQMSKLFRPFQQVDSSLTRKHGGAGLGLAISKRLALILGGDVTVSSRVGEGSAFVATIAATGASSEMLENVSESMVRNRSAESFEHRDASTSNGPSSQGTLPSLPGTISGTLHAGGLHTSLHSAFGSVGSGLNSAIGSAVNSGLNSGVSSTSPSPKESRSLSPTPRTAPTSAPTTTTAPTLASITNATLTTPPTSAAPVARPKHPQVLAGRRILLVEDGEDNRRILSAFLRIVGATLEFAENGQIAVDMIEKDFSAFDLVLMDMQMPVLDGYGATSQLRQRGYTTPIVALTAHALDSDRDKCLQAGCVDYVTKPINRQRLIEVCEKWSSKKE